MKQLSEKKLLSWWNIFWAVIAGNAAFILALYFLFFIIGIMISVAGV